MKREICFDVDKTLTLSMYSNVCMLVMMLVSLYMRVTHTPCIPYIIVLIVIKFSKVHLDTCFWHVYSPALYFMIIIYFVTSSLLLFMLLPLCIYNPVYILLLLLLLVLLC